MYFSAFLVLVLLASVFVGSTPVLEKLVFACRDLMGGKSWRIAAAMWVTVVMVCLLVVFATGLVIGGERVGIARLKAQPLTLRLLSGRGDPDFSVSKLEKNQIPRMKEIFGSGLVCYSPFRRVECQLSVVKNDVRSAVGRTVKLDSNESIMNHELLRHVTLANPRPYSQSQKKGIVLCPQFREKFNLGSGTPTPETVTLEVEQSSIGDPRTKTIEVLGELTDDLPEKVDFLMSESTETSLFYSAPVARVSMIETVDLDPHWLRDGQQALVQAAKSHFGDGFVVDVVATDLDDPSVAYFRIRTQDAEYSENEWNQQLSELNEVVGQAFGVAGASSRLIARHDGFHTTNLDFPTRYQYVGLYFDDPYLLPRAADFLESSFAEFERNVHRGQADQVANVKMLSEAQLKVLSRLQYVLGAMALTNLWVIQVLRAQHKRREAGMLKAVGVTNKDLFGIVCAEAAIVWLFAAFAGVVLGEIAGRIYAFFSYPALFRSVGFSTDWENVLFVFAMTALISIISAVVGSASWFLRFPGELMSE